MDISDWPMSKIMQLPDHCFGERFVVSACIVDSGALEYWDISEVGLPENCVIWEVGLVSGMSITALLNFRVALGDQLPASVAEMSSLDPLIMGLGIQGPDPRTINMYGGNDFVISGIRKYLRAGGRRLVLEVVGSADTAYKIVVYVVVSGIPRSIPDCLSLV